MLDTHTATCILTALSCFIPESSRTQLLLRARESKNGLCSLLSGDSLWKLSSVILNFCTNGRASDSSCDPISVHSKLVGQAFLGEAGIPGSHPCPNQAKKGAKTALRGLPHPTQVLCSLPGTWMGQGAQPPGTEGAQESISREGPEVSFLPGNYYYFFNIQ